MLRLYLGQLAKRRVLNATGLEGSRSLREHIAATTGPVRLLGLLASLPIRAYQLWSYRHERCRFPRGRNCSAVVLRAFCLYGVFTGLAVMQQLLALPSIGLCDKLDEAEDVCRV